jgi:hypothetical protein
MSSHDLKGMRRKGAHKYGLCFLFASIGCYLFVHSLFAADIAWGPAQDISSAADVITEGKSIYAFYVQDTNATGDWPQRTATNEVNGVKFSGNVRVYASNLNPKLGNCGGTNTTITFTLDDTADIWLSAEGSTSWNFRADPCTTNGSTTISSDYMNILTNMILNAANPMTGTNTLRKLTVGKKYKLQFWCNQAGFPAQSPGTCAIKNMSKVTQVTLKRSADGLSKWGQYAIGEFTADAETQSFIYTTSASGAAWNALQLRDVTKPRGTMVSIY